MFSHLDANNQPIMVDVGGKSPTRREAVAQAIVRLPESVLAHFRDGDIAGKKGPVFQTAVIAGIMACKKTSELIPLCHPLALEECKETIRLNERREAVVGCRGSCHQKTGVEMEALTGASVAALTLYDMCKAISHDIVIGDIRLLEKTGGKSDIGAGAHAAGAHTAPPSPAPTQAPAPVQALDPAD
jgi:cyclic pyranopterin phosphate synthase